jgi:hypothetical protein
LLEPLHEYLAVICRSHAARLGDDNLRRSLCCQGRRDQPVSSVAEAPANRSCAFRRFFSFIFRYLLPSARLSSKTCAPAPACCHAFTNGYASEGKFPYATVSRAGLLPP